MRGSFFPMYRYKVKFLTSLLLMIITVHGVATANNVAMNKLLFVIFLSYLQDKSLELEFQGEKYVIQLYKFMFLLTVSEGPSAIPFPL